MNLRLTVSYASFARTFVGNITPIDRTRCSGWQRSIFILTEPVYESVVVGYVRFQRLLKLMFIVEQDVSGRWRTTG